VFLPAKRCSVFSGIFEPPKRALRTPEFMPNVLAFDGKQLVAVCRIKPLRRLHCCPLRVSAGEALGASTRREKFFVTIFATAQIFKRPGRPRACFVFKDESRNQ
jgi:hypothetical protein